MISRPLVEASDDELRLAAHFAALRRTELLREGRLWLAARLNDLAVQCTEERDRRAELVRAVDVAFAEMFGVVPGEARLLHPPGQRRRWRR